MTAFPHPVLAHQGGWDEIAMVAGPLLVFAAVLYLANRRANSKLAAAAAEPVLDAEQADSVAE